MATELRRAADWCAERGVHFDSYGEGELIEEFEARIADLLGFPAARFLPSGTMAQPIALRVWADRAGSDHVAMHPTAHLELHEQHAYAHLYGLAATLLGPADRPLLAGDLAAAPDDVAALLVELPTREAGGLLPTWDELQALVGAARDRGWRLHLDGARLWECGPAYGRPYDEICAGFDSVYVSFYKWIGALPGAVLAGPADLVEEAAVWQRRAGGNLYTLTPNVASAAMRLDERLAALPTRIERARSLAATLNGIEGLATTPAVPQVNMFHLRIDLPEETALERRDAVAEELGLWLFGGPRPTDDDQVTLVEISVSDAAMQVSDDEVAAAFERLLGS